MSRIAKQSKNVFIWKIKNYLSCHIAHDERIESPTFEVTDLPVKNWILWLYPKGNSTSDYSKNKIIAFLVRNRPDRCSDSIVLDVKLEILNLDGSVLISGEFKRHEIEQTGVCGSFLSTIEDISMKNWTEDTLIIRCTMGKTLKESDDEIEFTEHEAVTTIDVERFVFKWHASNDSCFGWSKSVLTRYSTMPKFKITLTAPKEAVEIEIKMLNESLAEELVLFRIKFLSASGMELASKCESHLFDKSIVPLIVPSFIDKKDLLFGNFSYPYYKYTFFLEYTISKKIISCSNIRSVTINSLIIRELTTVSNFPSLQLDFCELYKSKKHADVKLRINSNDILAHKAILAARSPVFSAMFDQDMLENRNGLVEFEDMTEKILQHLLEYIYTDIVSVNDCESILKLLLAADKYQIPNLKDKCTSLIFFSVSVNNVCEVISVADLINHESLKTFALSFIFENVSTVLSTPSWSLWVERNMKLASEIMCKLSEYIKGKKSID